MTVEIQTSGESTDVFYEASATADIHAAIKTSTESPIGIAWGNTSLSLPKWNDFTIVGNNIDKNIRSSFQQLTHQTRSLHLSIISICMQ